MPPRTFDEHLDFARKLRRDMTVAETTLWRSLRHRRLTAKFRRQVPIGPYVADFACVAARLIIELDGRTHDELDQGVHDHVRDAWLTEHGWRVLRLPNHLILGGGDIAIDRIKDELSGLPSSGAPRHLLPQAGEGNVRD